MLVFSSSRFIELVSRLQWVAALVQNQPTDKQDEEIGDEPSIQTGATGHLNALLEVANQLELPATARSIERLAKRISEPTCTFREMGKGQAEIFSRLKDELSGTDLLYLEPRFATYYDAGTAPFGDGVFNAFPSAIRDVESAGKCLALSQPTASVFHLTRVMEAGLKALARPLGIPYAPSWESYLKQIETKIGEKHATKSVAWKKREPFFRDLCGDLQIVKMSFRNPTMHIVRHYTTDEAEEVYRAVRAFMKRLVDGGLKEARQRS